MLDTYKNANLFLVYGGGQLWIILGLKSTESPLNSICYFLKIFIVTDKDTKLRCQYSNNNDQVKYIIIVCYRILSM